MPDRAQRPDTRLRQRSGRLALSTNGRLAHDYYVSPEQAQHQAEAVFTALPVAQCLAIHDFVRVDLPVDAVLGAFEHFVSSQMVERLVLQAWTVEVSETSGDGDRSPPGPVAVTLGARRGRRDAVMVPIRWVASSGWLPPLDAELEIVGYGSSSTHLHVLGQSQLQPSTSPRTAKASLEHRQAVALVRRVLLELADMVTRSSGWSLGPWP